MVHKRQLAEDESDVSPKHLKLEHSCGLVPFLQFTNKDSPVQSDKDEGCFFKPIIGVDFGFVSGTTKDVDNTLPGRLSTSSSASSTMTEEDVRSGVPLQTPDHSPLKPRTLIQPADAYSYLLKRSPLKEVPIGPDYQADIPEWYGYDAHIDNREYEIKDMGSRVILMPEDDTICDNEPVGRGRTDCFCRNPRSLGCVRQHIKEARETLKESIGYDRFAELGFGDMGEVVAEKWTEEDEQLFHDVVYSNPASIGKNFWNHLAAEFPSRSNQEIVSYYFNVFVLRKRAEQNRFDPTNVDSDDDEWQGNDESNLGISYDQIGNRNFSDSTSQPSEKTMVDESGDGDHDFQYDSCTSSETAGAPRMKSWGNHEFIFEPSDSKVWDIGYFSCRRTKSDFLPTGSMIEEVFGVESWNFEATDDDKSSN